MTGINDWLEETFASLITEVAGNNSATLIHEALTALVRTVRKEGFQAA